MNTTDYLLEKGSAEDVAIIDGGRQTTYAELRTATATLVAALAEQRLDSGARVALIGPNSLFWVAGYLAVMKLGLVVVPFSDKATLDDVKRNLDIADCRAALVDRRSQRRFIGALGGIEIITDDTLHAPVNSYATVPPTDPDADAALMFTSGTTNLPKAVRITHGNIQANTDSIIAYLGLTRTDRVLVILPFFYCFGASLLHTHLRQGASIVLCNSFAYPETAIEILSGQECTVLAGVPSSFQLLLRATTYTSRPLPSLRIVQQAGGRLPPVLINELVSAHPEAQVFVMYGQTEATARLSYLPPDMLTERIGSIGKGIPGVELRVLREDMTPVSPGEKGEIYATGRNISPGYLGNPADSSNKFTKNGLRTGDLAVVDEDGYIFVVDRIDDFIKSWGYRVSSQEVEAVALQMTDLVSAAAVGVPDDEAGEAITLFATTRPGSNVSSADILAHCRAILPKHMVPRTIEIIDVIPVNANGKIAKTRLRDLARSEVPSD
ncbi:AMP-binding protein [Gordonia sp. CPCC 205515]|uniref:class I adenylate-forming enzyme family protein n=1 Tax=Gordonia sp. CPCC 205515 TaxID=3140791 RepID=UPI003AF34966